MGVAQDKMAEMKKARPVYTYDIPAPLANGITSIGIVELTTQEELMAAKRAAGDTHRLAYELTMQSLAEVNGSPVKLMDGSADKAFNDMGPKVRQLVMQAYGRLHGPEDSIVEGFLGSQKVKVG